MISRRSEIPIEISEHRSDDYVAWWQRDLGGAALPSSQLALFTRELASLVKAELPIDECLRILTMQPLAQPRLRRITASLLERVTEGEQLSGALAAHPAFPPYISRLVSAGEASGSLASVLDQLASYLERLSETRARVVSALVYPAVLVVASLAVIAVIGTVLLPAILPIFEDARVEPPFVVRALSTVGEAVSAYWVVLPLAIIALVLAFGSQRFKSAVREPVDRALLRTPILGSLITQRETGRFARILSLLLGSGVPMLETLRVSATTLSNFAFQAAMSQAADRVKEGNGVTVTLSRSGLLPDLFLRLAAVGEQSGQLDTMLLRVAEIYESAFTRQVDRLTVMVTPVLTLIIGGVVGAIVVSVLSAVLSINDLALQ
ncbi:type II secretion system F family protein [Hyphomicrobium sp.]|uniref:type II secretion system F family protein n=1 Tax=Hyphomicrobium sp. TaxID=82 RepID=UPI002E34B0E1|nr:type II secretion system F family protein [Hyphomicrobium sp.]HEX2841005.1 type II secretion system F family protein [Hyphomicrobium sp.]